MSAGRNASRRARLKHAVERRAEELARANDLLDRITDLQSRFIAEARPQELFRKALRHLVEVTESFFGFIAETVERDGRTVLHTYALDDLSWNAESHALYEKHREEGMVFDALDNLFGAVVATGAPVLANDPPNDPRGKGTPPGHPALASFLGLPLTIGGRLIGVAGLGNRAGGYQETQIEFLEPLLATVARLIDAVQIDARRKAAETRYRELTLAVEQSPNVVVITDTSGEILYANPRFTESTGYTLAEARGRNPRILKAGTFPPDYYRNLWQTLAAGGVWRGEFHNRRKSGEEYWENAYIAPIRDEAGAITRYIAVKEDITEKKAFERKMLHSERLAAIGNLAASVAHELNNPIGIILGYAEFLRDGWKGDPRTREVFDLLVEQSLRCRKIVKGLLAFARDRDEPRGPLALPDVCAEALRLVEATLQGAKIRTIAEHAPDLPKVHANRQSLVQVLVNLLTNAAQAMHGGGTIRLSTRAAGDRIVLEVLDDGPGVPKELRDKIFAPYFTTKSSGTGLGLAITAKIVESFGGSIRHEAPPAGGARFVVELPAAG